MRHSTSSIHPEHPKEQAYIERVHQAEEDSRARAARAPEFMGDKYAARTARTQMLERFSEPIDLDSLCFGRIDLETGKTHYLGRRAVHDEGGNLLVVNWRMPVAEAFYTGSRQDPRGLSRRRRFQLHELRLLGIVDEVFDAAANDDPEPRPTAQPAEDPIEPQVTDAILADMDRARGTEMRDIVATIEAQQYELISDDIEGLLVIQGGPGSGKTAIALHRAAWLLYNHREELGRSGVLIVGPNRVFMEYVARVLPTLGETTVVQSTVDRLPNLGDVRVRETEDAETARLKGDIRMAAVVQRAVIARVRRPDEDVTLSIDRAKAMLPADRVNALIDEAWRSGRTYNGAREVFRSRLVGLAQEQADQARRLFRSGPGAAAIEMAVTGAGGPLERIWPTVTAPEAIRDLLNSRQRLVAAGGSSLSQAELQLLQRERERLISDEPWTAADMPLLDEADAALRGSVSSYGYVLADEAQDLSPMQLRMILRRSPTGRATLVGDIAQATGPARFPDWTDLLDAASVDAQPRIAELALGYRVPRQVMDIAAQILPRIAPDLAVPTAVREGPESPRLLSIDEATFDGALASEVVGRLEGDRSVGVIAPADALERVHAALVAAEVEAGDILTDGLTHQVTVLSAEQSKGLEFDHVVVVDPTAIAGPDGDWAYVYIALTRATRTLSVLYSTPDLDEVADETSLPDPPIEASPILVAEAPRVDVEPTEVVLGARYTEAMLQAKFLYAGRHRHGTSVPYLAHLQAVAALVLEHGGSEDEAIAALLHDAVEDHGPAILERIADQFGVDIARIVAECTAPETGTTASWRDRKLEHLRALETAGAQVRRVALAEKLDNATALLRGYRRFGDGVWDRMGIDADDQLWYIVALADLFPTERLGDMASEFQDVVERLIGLATPSETIS